MNLNNKVDGSLYSPEEWNEFKNELQNLIVSSGQSLTSNSLQIKQAAARYAANAASYTDSGIADAYSLVPMNNNDAVSVYANGTIVSFKAGNTNTGNSTLVISGLGIKTIKKNGFVDILVAGDIEVNKVYTLFYSLSDDAFDLISGGSGASVPDASESTKGILKIVTQGLFDGGVNDTDAVTALKMANSSFLSIVDEGSNANGHFIEYSNGLFQQWITTPLTIAAGASLAVIFPVNFPVIPMVVVMDDNRTDAQINVGYSARTAAGFTADNSGSGSIKDFTWSAIGRL